MMWFTEWVEFDRRRKERERKNVQSTSPRSTEVGHVHQQGKTAGVDTPIQPANVHLFPEP